MHTAWAFLGRLIYRVFGVVALPVFLHNTARARVIILDDADNVLLSKTWIGDQAWDFVGGGIDKNEDMFVAAIRETREETGLRLAQKDIRLVESITSSEYMARYVNHIFVAHVAHFTAKKPPIEILELAWHPVHKLPKKQRSHVRASLAKVTTKKT